VVRVIPVEKYPVSPLVKLFIPPLSACQQTIRGRSPLGDRLVNLRTDLPRAALLGDAPVHDRPGQGGSGEEPRATEWKTQDGSP
jgi:hypothetical protein